ncbi:MAG: PDZ domain-containing protein [Deltaproteobacteria bacterium]|nr:PDZ domain-containing protein [Deltaproteobacteria bacterium]
MKRLWLLVIVPPLLLARAEAKDSKPKEEDETPAALQTSAGFKRGEAAFLAAKKTLLDEYYRKGLSEDDLYRAATLGLLNFVDPDLKRWNTLLSPDELKELHNSLKGEIVGVGVALRFSEETGYGEVLDVLPGTAAEKAGMKKNDLIVSVNGKLYKGLSIDALVKDIRGKAGEVVKMMALRGDKMLPFSLTRAVVTFDAVEWRTLPLGARQAGLLCIRSFTEKTPALVDQAFAHFEQAKAAAIVVDLRGNHGGSFEDALTVTERFVASGQTMVRLQMRAGESARVSKGTPRLLGLPLAVLVDDDTASGAELFAAALRDARHAAVIGKRTFGKGTVQRVDELPNGYGIKYTVGLFSTPSGRAIQQDGLVPDVEIEFDEVAIERVRSESEAQRRLSVDAPLRTALGLLAPKI